jgi:hypothetical protein
MQSKTWIAAIVMLLAAGLRLLPGVNVDDNALMNFITLGVEIFGPIFIVFRGWAMGRHTLSGRALPSR